MLEDKILWKRSNDLVTVFDTLENIGFGDYVVFDPQIIRGLDYYTGVVFEAKDIDKEGRSILGGGHYGTWWVMWAVILCLALDLRWEM